MRLDSKSDTSEVSPDAARAKLLIEKLQYRVSAGPPNYVPDAVPIRADLQSLAESDDVTFGDLRELVKLITQRDARLAAIVQEWRETKIGSERWIAAHRKCADQLAALQSEDGTT